MLQELSSRKTVIFEKQIGSIRDKYPSIFSPQIEAIALIILQIILPTRLPLKIGEYHSDIPQF